MNALKDYMRDFAGYGHLQAPLWFVGMEEGGGRNVAELQRRVETWEARGRRPLEDLAEFHHAIGEPKHFREPYPLQPTWASLARILQGWRGAAVDIPSLQQVQATSLGSKNGLASLVELLLLPSPNVHSWPYAALAEEHPALVDRIRYRSAFLSARIGMLQERIQEAQPRAVIFYGLGYLKHWSALSEQVLEPIQIETQLCYGGQKHSPYFFAIPHPAARGMTKRFWESAGTHLRDVIGAS